jgi:hypothetical protein
LSPPHSGTRANLRRWTALVGAVFYMVTACLTWAALAWPSGGFARLMAGVLPISAPHAAAAERDIVGNRLADASARTNMELAVSPLHEEAWLRRARIDEFLHAHLTKDGLAALKTSYDVLPYDLNPNSERMVFVLSHFSGLTPGLQADVSDEIAVWAFSAPLRRRLIELRVGIKDPVVQGAIQSTLTDARIR